MRIVGFLALALLLPVSALAALIDINTADATTLDTLPGIGPTKAAAIVDYRTVNGPFARIEDIQDVTGIGPSTYADIAPLITVGSTVATTAASTTEAVSSSGSMTTYVPPPDTLSLSMSGPAEGLLEVPVRLSARVTTKGGAVDAAAQVQWSFGDGSWMAGTAVEKIYRYAGTYLVTAVARDGDTTARAEHVVVVKPSAVRISAVTHEGIAVTNDSGDRVDLSGWRLLCDTGTFRIPEGMMLLPESSVFFPFSITNLPIAFSATLTYPSGIIASRFAPDEPAPAPVQPAPASASYHQVQEVESIISTRTDVQLHDEAVEAPAAPTELAAAGAALPPPGGVANFLRSPWTLSFVGLMMLAGGAFILL